MHSDFGLRGGHGGDIYGYGPGVIDFSANISPLGMPEEIRRAAEEAAGHSDIYPDVRASALRDAASRVLGVDGGSLAFGAGACDLIYRITLALKPDKVLIECPAFSEYRAASALAGATVITHTELEDNGFRMRTEELIRMIVEEKPDTVFIASPSNPVGITTGSAELLAILSACEEIGARLVADVCFSRFTAGGASELYRYIKEHPGLVIVDSFTKIFSMAGIRFGFAAFGDREDARRVMNVLQPWPLSTAGEAAGKACFSLSDKAAEAAVYTAAQREHMTDELRNFGLKVFDGEANYILIKGEADLADRLLEKGFLVRRCANYTGLDERFIRVAVKTAGENEKLLRAFGEVI